MEQLETRALLAAATGDLHVGILLLDHSNQPALTVNTSNLNVVNGSIVVDSKNAAAAISGGHVTTNELDFAGKKALANGGTLNASVAHTPLIADPLASMPAPTPAGPTFKNVRFGPFKASPGNGFRDQVLLPGTYVGGIHIFANEHVTLLPGIYYLEGGGLTVRNAALQGTGVTIINAPKGPAGGITFYNADIDLTAQSSGPYQGIVLFQQRYAQTPIVFSGDSGANLTGIVYAPNAVMKYNSRGLIFVRGTDDMSTPGELILKRLNCVHSMALWVLSTTHEAGDIGVTVTDDQPTDVAPGTVIHETITVTNLGSTVLDGIHVADAFPAGFDNMGFVATTSGESTYSSITPNLGSGINDTVMLLPGQWVTYHLTGKVDPAASGELVNTITATPPAGEPDPDLSNNVATDLHQITSN